MKIGILGSGLMGGKLDDVLHQAGILTGKVIVTCSLPMKSDDTDLVVAHTSSGAEELAKKIRNSSTTSGLSRSMRAHFASRGTANPLRC